MTRSHDHQIPGVCSFRPQQPFNSHVKICQKKFPHSSGVDVKIALERARRQLPTLADDVLHHHGRIPPASLSRTEIRTSNSVAEDAAELHEGVQVEMALLGTSHEEEQD